MAPSIDPEEVRRSCEAAGFDRAGFAAAGPAPHAGRLREWLGDGCQADMDWMARSAAKRSDPRAVLEGARTVIALAAHYGTGGDEDRSCRSGAEAEALAREGRGEISRYARGTDYHRVLEGRLAALCRDLAARHPGGRFRWYVDTGPVLERSWAEAAGIGWIGKNACAIDPARGSYFFISVVLTTLEVPPDPPSASHCGSCRLCIDACPTGAIAAPHRIDAGRCISYLTIERRGPIPEELRSRIGGLVFGCDICQEVCPFNRPDRLAGDPDLAGRPENRRPDLAALAALEPGAFAARFPRSAVRRARAAGLLRNAVIALGNGGPAGRRVLEGLRERPDIEGDPMLRETLAWALDREQVHPASAG